MSGMFDCLQLPTMFATPKAYADQNIGAYTNSNLTTSVDDFE